jgi:putative nucleotidyltransferase with HDIG domain
MSTVPANEVAPAPRRRSVGLDPASGELIEESRARAERGPSARQLRVAALLAATVLVAATALVLALPSERPVSLWLLGLLIAAYALASRVQFEVGPGIALPTQLVLVPMLFVLPLALVPAAVACGLVLAVGPEYVRRREHAGALLRVAAASHALGPVVVLAAAGESAPSWDSWPIYALALATQFAFDFAVAGAWSRLALGISPWPQLRFMRWSYGVDAALAPVGLLVAFASVSWRPAFLLMLPLVGLLALFAREREARIDHALELGHAYRGTALLLGDVIEADDSYTGSHSRDVVELTLAVASELGLDAASRREAELTALLHDVGKIRIPTEIINKPGPLTPEERAIVETHTIEGERMLERVGGLLGDVGKVVRSHHEHFDGNGYPDGLAGEAIPLSARIVTTCDAFSAMTTDRSYRRALPVETAVAELRRHSGTQFDPKVVEALVAVVERDSIRAHPIAA